MKLRQFLIAVDQLLNTILNGWADETLSARLFRSRDKSKAWNLGYRFVNKIFFLEENHCEDSYLSEIERRHYPNDYKGL